MKKTNTGLRLSDGKSIIRDLPKVTLGVLALAAILFSCASINQALADEMLSPAISVAQGQAHYVPEDEENAYRAAKREPDFNKRAEKLMEFLQKYPKSVLMQPSDYENIKGLEAEDNAFYAARQEPDFNKRADMLIDLLLKYPDSSLVKNINYEYTEMLKDCSQSKKYELLESLSEKWLKTHSNDKDTYGFIAEATCSLGKYERCGQCLEAIYKLKPLPSLAKEILATYQKTENLAKQDEWTDKILKMPEFADDYMLRYGLVTRCLQDKNNAQAAEYAQLTLKCIESVQQPEDAKNQEQVRRVRRACYHVIGTNEFKQGKFGDAISAFEEAVKVERYQQGYYEIAVCLENQKQIEEANVYYAAAELMGGEFAPKAKARLEELYRALHNNTLIGIDKIYKKAQELLADPEA